MTQENKPREFWIVESKKLKIFEYDKAAIENLDRQKALWPQEGGHIIHVIEYSAYQQLIEENKKLKDQVDTLSYHSRSDYAVLKDELDRHKELLRQQCNHSQDIQAKLDVAVNAIQDYCYCANGNVLEEEKKKRCREAIQKIEGAK